MTDTVHIERVDEVYVRVNAEPSIIMELSDQFTFLVPGAKHMPLVKARVWDGKIRLLDTATRKIYTGLVPDIVKLCESRGYDITVDPDVMRKNKISPEAFTKFVESLEIQSVTPHDYQLDTVHAALRNRRALFLSPTSSGKSLIAYMITRFFYDQDQEVLIIVPTTSLVLQMKKNFEEYLGSEDIDLHIIMSGQDKNVKKKITISTWQSLYQLPRSFFARFDCVIGDEAHLWKAKCLSSILEKLVDCKYRIGMTGSLDGSMTNEMVLRGLFGPIHRFVKTTELQDRGQIAKLKIKGIMLQYTQAEADLVRKQDYQGEVTFLYTHDERNRFICNLAASTNQNTLVLFRIVDHGRTLEKMLRDSGCKKQIFFVYGGVAAEERENIRQIAEKNNDVIIIASYGTFSTGVSINNLHHVIAASPVKSRVTVLQSIGRGLRLHGEKDFCTWYDIGDDLRYKGKTNFTLKHFMERIKIYESEGFDYKIIGHKL